MSNFYVYEHWRSDTETCFYVGKGRGTRAYWMHSRNRYHTAIRKKLERTGGILEIRIIKSGLTEDDAFALERERIAYWRAFGAKLANLTDGGEGPSGNQFRLGAILSEETRKKIGASRAGKPLTDAHKAVLSSVLSGEKNPFYGKSHSEATRAKVAEANRKRVWSAESKAKMSETIRQRPCGSAKGKTWKLSDETKRRQSEAVKKRWADFKERNKCLPMH